MEAALVSSVLKMLLPKIFAFLHENHELRRGLDGDIQYIRNELGMIAAAIEDHDRRSRCGVTSEAEGLWIHVVRDLAYSIEDSIDRFLHRVSLELGASSLRQKQHRLLTLSIRTEFAAEIRKLRRKSEEASRLRDKYAHGSQSGTMAASASTFTASDTHTPASDLVGMDAPRDELLDLMREDNQPKQLKVISIVGFGGLGKTVLARQVYNCVAGGGQYEPMAWVRASENGAGDVLEEILQQAGMHVQNCDVNKLIARLKTRLQSKRFFIVIDDVQTEYWNIIKYAFPREIGVSSRVIVTTAIHSIANACSSINGQIYIMRPLDEEHSKQLFFKEASLVCYKPAEQVVKKCDGLPIALVTTAQLLQSKGQLTPEGCANLCRYMGEHVEKEETLARMKNVFLHSYSSLPGHILKACLLYFAIFPCGHPIKKKCLIRRWLAEGFIEADHRRSASVVATDNFRELINRSIIQAVDTGNNRDAKTCHTHTMMLEFLMQKSICENVITLLYDQSRLPDKVRRLSLHQRGTKRNKNEANIDLSFVRSLTIFGKLDQHVSKFGKYKLLRVLDLEESEGLKDEHVKNICEHLLLLRYLSLGGDITALPKEISKLRFLETLDVRRAKANFLNVPIEVIMLPCLTYLLGVLRLSDVGHKMSKVQTFLSENSNLETLAGFYADQVILQLMRHMNGLTKVKLWFEPTGDDSSNCCTNLSRPIQEFIQRGTDINETRSLSVSFNGCSQSFLDFSLKENSYYLRSLKLHGELCTLPPFVNRLGCITELCLHSPNEMNEDVLTALGSIFSLHYLKLVARQLWKFIIEPRAFGSLHRLCIVVQSMTSLENQEGALQQLESLCLLCKDLDGLCGARIEYLGHLKEIVLDDGTSEETKKQWKEAAKMHLRQPRVSLLKTRRDDKTRESSMAPATSTPEDGIHVRPNGGSEPSTLHKMSLFSECDDSNRDLDMKEMIATPTSKSSQSSSDRRRWWRSAAEKRMALHGRKGASASQTVVVAGGEGDHRISPGWWRKQRRALKFRRGGEGQGVRVPSWLRRDGSPGRRHNGMHWLEEEERGEPLDLDPRKKAD